MRHRFHEHPDSTYVETSASRLVFQHLHRPRCDHLLVLGEAGTGKTALLQQLGLDLESRGHLVISLHLGRVRSLEELIAWLIARLIDSVSLDGDEALMRLRTAYGTVSREQAGIAMATVLEHLSRLAGDPVRIYILLDGLDERMPDAHGLFERHIVEWLAAVPVEYGSIVLTSRRSPAIDRSANDLRSLTVVRLGGWTEREVAEILKRGLRSRNMRPSQTLVDNAIAASRGSPLLAMRMLDYAEHTGRLPEPDLVAGTRGLAVALAFSVSDFEAAWGKRDEFWALLLVCWAARRNPASEIERATGIAPARIDAWIAMAEARAFIRRDGNAIVALEVLDRAVMTELLPDGIDLDRLAFGDEAAELDPLLTTSFEAPADIPDILAGTKTIVLGDRGAGKSAIYRTLSKHAEGAPANGTIVAASKEPSDFLYKMGSANNPSAERFKAIWLLYVARLAARELQDRVDTSRAKGKRYRDDCHRLLRSLGLDDEIKDPSLMSRLASPLRALLPEKVSFTVGPVQIEQEFNNAEKASSNAVDINEFLKRTEAVLQEAQLRLVVVFDQIDEAHKYQPSQVQLVQGLLMAESKLAQTQAIRMVVLLRTDLYEIYHIEEKNKFVSRTAWLSWSPPQLAQQLLLRSYSNQQLRLLAERLSALSIDKDSRELIQMRVLFPAVVERKEFWHWLMDGLTTGNGRVAPRQIVLFMNLLKVQAKGGGIASRIPLYSESQVLAALKELSRLSYNEVIDDFKVATVLVQNCKALNLDRFKFADVAKMSDPGEGTPAAQVDQLRRLGFFQHAVGQEDGEVVMELQVAALYRRFWT